jgi:hypothetical protein
MELLSLFKRPVSNLVRIHTKNYRYLLPESIHLFNVYQKFYDNNKSYDLYGWKDDTLIDIYATYHSVLTKDNLPVSWRNYINEVMRVTKMKKMDILIYNLKYNKYTNVIHYIFNENTEENQNIIKKDLWTVTDKWITASSTKNYIMEDTILDILNKKDKISKIDENTTYKRKRCEIEDISDDENINKKSRYTIPYINNEKIQSIKIDYKSDEKIRMDMGNIFERDIIDQLIKKYYLDFIKIADSFDAKSIEKYNNTINAMKKGIPIIYQGVLHNPEKEEYGCVDLLVRADWIEKIFNMKYPNLLDTACKIDNIHYVVIDIKFHKLQLNSDKLTVRNEGMIKVFKSQICIYNNALGVMQGYLPKHAFILGSGWILSKIEKGQTIIEKCHNPFDRCGVIDFEKKDLDIVEKTDEACKWLRELNENEFDVLTLKYNHNYPNMSSTYDSQYKERKSSIAEENKEITLISYLTPKNRKIAIENGITNYLDKNINSQKLGLKGKTGEVVETLLNNQKELDKPIKGNYQVPEQLEVELFLDYEFFHNFITHETIPYLCGIGIVKKENNNWFFENVLLDDVKDISLEKMCKKIIDIIKTNCTNNKIRIYTWTDTDRRIFVEQCNKFKLLDEIKDIEWIDGYKFCLDNRINFKDARGYGLKEIGSILNKHKLTEVNWVNNLSKSNGAYKYYMDNQNWPEKEGVLYYNEIDCKIIYEIFKNLRKFQN